MKIQQRLNYTIAFLGLVAQPLFAGNDWTQLREQVKPAIVNVQIVQQVGFMDECPSTYNGTGSVVDWQNGLVATNKHVAGISPTRRTELVFSSGEATAAQLIYYHPWHDVAIIKFDPKTLKRTAAAQVELGAHTDLKEGEQVLQIGNTASQPYSMAALEVANKFTNQGLRGPQFRHSHMLHLSGMIAGGASGSPIFNQTGKMVGLINSSLTTQSFALRIEYVKDIVASLQKGLTPRVGELHVRFGTRQEKDIYQVYEPTSILAETMERVRKSDPDLKRFIVVMRAEMGTPAGNKLRPDDVLMGIKGAGETEYRDIGQDLYLLDNIVDRFAGQSVDLKIFRQGEVLAPVTLPVDSIEGIAIKRYVTFAGATFHELTTNQALFYGISRKGVFLAEARPGESSFDVLANNRTRDGEENIGSFGKREAVLHRLGVHPTENLNQWITAVLALEAGGDPTTNAMANDYGSLFTGLGAELITLDFDFDPLRAYHFNEQTHTWVEDPLPK